MILIAESGSTKTEWRVIDSKQNVFHARSGGINPYYLDASGILEVMRMGLIEYIDTPFKEVYFYGAGCSSNRNKQTIRDCFMQLFPNAKIEVNHDMLAAARSLCGIEPGIACILGTGSNSCLYDGIGIIENVRSLGYILGDEGSGNYLGKQFLKHYFKKELPVYIREQFDEEFGLEAPDILNNIYHHHMPILYLSSFSKFIFKYLKDPMIYQLVYDAFKRFIEVNVMKYTNYKNVPVHFTGSVAYYYEEVLRKVGADMDIQIKDIVVGPIDGLIAYHQPK
ncbi:N-acetylglucosamine kinase [Reichenbachiella carrageenanivorans]|uniref:N-acetylglucosamine kinase n=1 Tax=Reichenbachiella carrageenanivorans TaxID=2979869 RepID=A0ABY6CYP4_9BACT|nr:N-acetylglucosamine kinase [Reichenbachiella carrageenanivorans]UXX79046.1 N-acetylglucosamine kinase [Reichenbachiella carrageenanivorans]